MKQILVQAFGAAPRGSQSRIADTLGVRVQTVNKWSKGHNVPEPQHWRTLEGLLGLTSGTLTVFGDVDADDQFGAIRAELAELRGRIEVLEAQRVTNDEFAMAAHSGKKPFDIVTVDENGDITRVEVKAKSRRASRPRPRPEQGEHVDA